MLRVALVQLTSGPDMAANIAAADALIREAAAGGATLIATPETTHLMQMDRQRVLQDSFFEQDDPGLAHFCALAAELGVVLAIGSLIIRLPGGHQEVRLGEQLANRSYVIGPTGEITARYDKIHMFDVTLGGGESYRESALYRPGGQLVVADVEAGGAEPVRLGLSVCYDVRFPLLFRRLAQAGASVLMVPAAFTQPTGEAHWQTLLRARAIETGCYILAAAQAGCHPVSEGCRPRLTHGHSLLVDPWGAVIAEAGREPGVISANIDLPRVERARGRIPSLALERVQALDLVVNPDHMDNHRPDP